MTRFVHREQLHPAGSGEAADERARRWRIAIDTGGTFTDAIAIDPADPSGRWRRAKVPSDGAVPLIVLGHGGGADGAAERAFRLRVPSWLPAPERFLLNARLVGVPSAFGDGEVVSAVLESAGTLHAVVRFARPIATDISMLRVRPFPSDGRGELDAPMLAVHVILGVVPGDPLPPMELRLSTTRGTNALLERAGARTALCITHGFEDLLRIGDQSRPELFARRVPDRDPLVTTVIGVDERMLADGPRRPLTDRAIDDVIEALRRAEIDSVAISLLHGMARPEHERRLAEALRAAGFRDVAVAGSLSDSPRFLSRTETAVVHAMLAPVLRTYLGHVARRIPDESTFVMTSAGGLQRADRVLARDALLSGPAGGVAALAEIAERTGRRRLLGLDMGGTSTDVARYDGAFAYRYETKVGDARVAAPSLAIESVAAGGGSICTILRGELRVGPESAKALPGPACYGQGGPLTLTDVNLLLGRLDRTMASLPLDLAAAERALAAMLERAARECPEPLDRASLLAAFVDLANERMAGAIEAISMREGVDPRDYTLVPFGGAGGQHAAAIAERLGIREILLPHDAGILSARGLLGALPTRFASRAVLAPLDGAGESILRHVADAEQEALAAIEAECSALSSSTAATIAARSASLRLDGQDQTLELTIGAPLASSAAPKLAVRGAELEAELARAFEQAFTRIFGYAPPARPLVVEAIRVQARLDERLPVELASTTGGAGPAGTEPSEEVEREGPELLVDGGATAYLPAGWRVRTLARGDRLVTPSSPRRALSRRGATGELDLFACRLEAIATAMGEALRRTAISANVKERLDFSCAILDARGILLQNAPHLPVHLGAMGVCVRGVHRALRLRPGDVAITNHPVFGGSHLPDVTVITPVFSAGWKASTEPIAFVANRAHHAEIGGTRPGSFPPDARSLAEEGVVIPPMLLVEAGERAESPRRERLDRIEALLRDAPYPSRCVDENLADLRAAIAANEQGVRMLTALVEEYGAPRVAELAEALLTRTARTLESALRSRGDCEASVVEHLDDGTPIAVRVTVREGRARIDFTGSGGLHPRNANAPIAVVRAATMYALRLLVDEPIPMNEGLLRPVELIVPRGLLNPVGSPDDGFASTLTNSTAPTAVDPAALPPVVAGNTETSQRVTDALLRALELAAGSQGTMNNLLFGNARYGAYETIAGGSGATAAGPGGSAVHTHMTNTRITDAEILERRAPVIVRTFAVRSGSGGAGQHRGGDGILREIEFREATQVSILAEHRVEAPYGMAGGGEGARGNQALIRADGSVERLPGRVAVDCAAGEAIRIETPGGGAWGAADRTSVSSAFRAISASDDERHIRQAAAEARRSDRE
jgi:5-oxoprolinase (ATP-hydrolysing)